jgi:hypothetical protein
MTGDKEDIDDLYVGLLINKAKAQGSPARKSHYISAKEAERRRVLLSEDADSIEEDTNTDENQILQLLENCQNELYLLKKEVHELKIQVTLLSMKRKKE